MKKFFFSSIILLFNSSNVFARNTYDNEGALGSLFIAAIAILAFFGVGVIISPIWNLLEPKRPKQAEKTIYDRKDPSHAHLFKGYPNFKGRYIKVPKSQIEKDKFWKKFRKKYFKNKH